MSREISSAATPIYKAVFLLLFGCSVPIFIFLTINGIKDSQNVSAFQILIAVLKTLAEIFFAILFVRLALNWKKVEIEDSGLTITNVNFFVKRISTFVPFENINAARQNFFLQGNPGTVTIEFNEPVFFGKKITFVPTFRSLTMFKHPIVEEVNRLANHKKAFIS